MYILAFETSCDETSVAVLENDKILSNVILSQLFHNDYGGVIPEIASREHLKSISGITESALNQAGISINQIELVAATNEPGLIGAILIGLNYAKSVAFSLGVPFVPVNHIQAHLYSSFIGEQKPEFPFISLIVSGGHTLLVLVEDFFKHKILGSTVDDAAGEAFDKVAKMLNLGYPGGPVIDKLASQGNLNYHSFPLAHVKNAPFDFSFSGIKTSVLYHLRDINFKEKNNPELINNICASFQYAVVESLFRKTLKAAKQYKVKNITVSGGVSANTSLKSKFNSLIKSGYRISIPSIEYSTDNGAMIGITAYFKYIHRLRLAENNKYFLTDSFKSGARPRLDYDNF